ncbi:2-hydroxyacid dehydrogenase [Aureibacillus halotolerans]|uniref:Glyoxylate reductase n=1 Tax=Aureibacillus halotolerans TaxID=1508390 RepID=A0A4R6TYZ8_9BACI|nr:D-glycerate dehydrogenase [Aureibacillus halotolerans]TDQ37195.1 glyoxylate reductase [Aureibacillus halotolerans]
MTNTVYVTRKLPEEAVAELRASCKVRMWDKEEDVVPREVLEKEIATADGLLSMLTDPIDEDLLKSAQNLKAISQMAVGHNNIDIEAASARQIAVLTTPGVLTETTADLTFALLMAVARRIPEAERFLKKGDWTTWSPMLLTGADVYGATLGIIGLGRIGEAVAKRAKGFSMDVVYHSRSRKPEKEARLGLRYGSMDDVLAQSDYLVLMIPYSKETHHLIDADAIKKMKPSCFLINTARGDIVDEKALYDALVSGDLAGAGLDVFAQEPVPTSHPLLTLDNVVALPHIGSASVTTRRKMATMAAKQLVQTLHGERPPTLINAQALDEPC